MTKPSDTQDYEVGYGKPPKATQFKGGQSGNPKGRPKGVLNAATVLRGELNRRVTVTEGGISRSITKLEAATKQLTNKAAGGDPRAVQLLFSLLNYYEVREASAPSDAGAALATPADEEVQREMLRRFNQLAAIQTDGQG